MFCVYVQFPCLRRLDLYLCGGFWVWIGLVCFGFFFFFFFCLFVLGYGGLCGVHSIYGISDCLRWDEVYDIYHITCTLSRDAMLAGVLHLLYWT